MTTASLSAAADEVREAALVVMFIQFGPFDAQAVRLDYPTNVAGLDKKFACHVDCGIP